LWPIQPMMMNAITYRCTLLYTIRSTISMPTANGGFRSRAGSMCPKRDAVTET